MHISNQLILIDHSTEGNQINTFTFTGTEVNAPAIEFVYEIDFRGFS